MNKCSNIILHASTLYYAAAESCHLMIMMNKKIIWRSADVQLSDLKVAIAKHVPPHFQDTLTYSLHIHSVCSLRFKSTPHVQQPHPQVHNIWQAPTHSYILNPVLLMFDIRLHVWLLQPKNLVEFRVIWRQSDKLMFLLYRCLLEVEIIKLWAKAPQLSLWTQANQNTHWSVH